MCLLSPPKDLQIAVGVESELGGWVACTKAPKLPSSGTHPDSVPLKYRMVTPSSFELSALLSSGRASEYVHGLCQQYRDGGRHLHLLSVLKRQILAHFSRQHSAQPGNQNSTCYPSCFPFGFDKMS